MSADERTEPRQRFQEWRQMSPEDQQRLRERFQRFREGRGASPNPPRQHDSSIQNHPPRSGH